MSHYAAALAGLAAGALIGISIASIPSRSTIEESEKIVDAGTFDRVNGNPVPMASDGSIGKPIKVGETHILWEPPSSATLLAGASPDNHPSVIRTDKLGRVYCSPEAFPEK